MHDKFVATLPLAWASVLGLSENKATLPLSFRKVEYFVQRFNKPLRDSFFSGCVSQTSWKKNCLVTCSSAGTARSVFSLCVFARLDGGGEGEVRLNAISSAPFLSLMELRESHYSHLRATKVFAWILVLSFSDFIFVSWASYRVKNQTQSRNIKTRQSAVHLKVRPRDCQWSKILTDQNKDFLAFSRLFLVLGFCLLLPMLGR